MCIAKQNFYKLGTFNALKPKILQSNIEIWAVPYNNIIESTKLSQFDAR
jgi:hypothetical protein